MALRQRMPKPPSDGKSPEKNSGPDPPVDKSTSSKPDSKPLRAYSARRQRSLASSRVHVVLSAVAIGLFFAFSNRLSSKSKDLPDSWALCSRRGKSVIYTVDDARPNVECIVVHKKHILDWGTAKEVKNRWGDKDTTGPPMLGGAVGSEVSSKSGLKFFWLKDGSAAYPGFSDAHAHILEYGATRELNLVGAVSTEEVRERIRKYIRSKPELLNDKSIWIQSQGWDQNLYPGASYPTASDLEDDDMLRDRPISLQRIDVHASWVSPKVLEMMGDLPESVDGGLIVRDPAGKPTGIFVDNAMGLVEAVTPPWSEHQMIQYFHIAMKDAVAHGLTSIHDAFSLPANVKLFKKLASMGALPIRLNLMAHVLDKNYWGGQLEKLIGYADDRLNVRSVKLFTDGALGSWGAALLEPYSDQPENRGLMRMDTEAINEHITRFVHDGWQTNVHCIGDRANHEVLNAFEMAFANASAENKALRHRIEHAQILTQADIKRVAQLGLIASVQPTHATSDMGYAELRLGPERIKGAYAWRTLIESGARLVIGSDFPVEGVNPLLGFYAAVTRLDVLGDSPHGKGGWYPEQRLTRHEALRGMTLGASYAAHQEEILGSLTPGKRADIVILEKDIMVIPPADILKTKVTATIVDGALAYGRV